MTVYPSAFSTISQMRDILASGTVRVFWVEVRDTLVDGAAATEPHRGRAGDITYNIRPLDTQELFDPVQLEGIKPINRKTDNAAIWSAMPGDLMAFVRYGPGSLNAREYHLYALTEYPAYVNCQGEWID